MSGAGQRMRDVFRELGGSTIRRALRNSVVEGVLYAAMLGLAEMYFVADAIRLRATAIEIGLVVGLPLALGGVTALASVAIVERFSRRRPVVVAGVLAQALVLFVLSAIEGSDRGSPTTLILAVCCYHVCAQIVAAPWASWFGDLVPNPIRGRYFAMRGRWVHLASFGGLLAGGALLQWLEGSISGGSGRGFCLLFAIAGACRVASAGLLFTAPEPRLPRATSLPSTPRRGLLSIDGPAARLLPLSGLLYFAVYLGSPFFTPFMLEVLQFSYLEYTAVTAAMVLAKVLYMRSWGRSIDHHGPVTVYRLAIVLLALVPLPWLWADSIAVVAAAQAVSGFSWAAHEVSLFTLLLETSEPNQRARVYAGQSFATGLGQLAGSLVGGVILTAAGGHYQTVFAVTAAVRLTTAIGIGLAIRPLAARVPIGRRALLWRVLGMRAHGGVIHRPLPATPSSPDLRRSTDVE